MLLTMQDIMISSVFCGAPPRQCPSDDLPVSSTHVLLPSVAVEQLWSNGLHRERANDGWEVWIRKE